MNYHHASDEDLVGRLAGKDTRALEELYDRYRKPVYSLALRIVHDASTADEIAQEVFLKLWRQPEHYAPERGRFASWLLSVTHHRAIDVIRSRRTDGRFDPAHLPAGFDTRSTTVDPADEVWYREERAQVLGALAQLPAEQRRAIELAYFSGLTQSQIAVATGEPLGTVKTRIRLGMQKLRVMLSSRLTGIDRHVDA